jgi:hypothetical protein
MVTIGRNDPCHCPSGKKYKHCCLPLDENRPARISAVHQANSLKEKNLTLLAGAADIFNLKQPWDKVKSGMTDTRIREFYQFIAALWPVDTDYRALLPKPDGSLRALYLGENDPEMMMENVFRFSLYADEIILVNPFDNPNLVAEKYNPAVNPGEWRLQTLRLVYHLQMLAPWIVAGLVKLIPDPGDFNRKLREETWSLAAARLAKNPITSEDVDKTQARKKTQEMFYMLPDDYVRRTAKEHDPNTSTRDVEKIVEYFRAYRSQHPLLLNATMDQIPGQMTAMRMGANLEMGLYLCQTIGAFPYTNVPFRWKEILSASDQLDASAQVWSPLTNAFGNLNFKFLNKVDSNFAVTMRQEERLGSFRSYMRKLWKSVDGNPDPTKIETLARDFKDELEGEYAKAQADWSAIDRDLVKWAVPAIGGIISTVAGIVTGHYALALGSPLTGQGISEFLQRNIKRGEFRKSNPLSVFIDLEEMGE